VEKEFLKRFISSFVLLPIVLGSFYLGGLFFIVLISLVVVISMIEWDSIIKLNNYSILYILRTYLCIPILFFLFYLSEDNYFIIFLFVVLFLTFIISFQEKKYAYPTLGYIFIFCPAISIVFIRFSSEFEYVIVISFFTLVWLSDIGGYCVGKIIGGPKLIPSISPGKTLSGAFGSILFPVITIFIANIFIKFNNLILVIVLTILISILAQLGDLSESLFKRKFGVKNSGYIIPGHGGILDRIDSFVYTLPFFLFLYFSDKVKLWY